MNEKNVIRSMQLNYFYDKHFIPINVIEKLELRNNIDKWSYNWNIRKIDTLQ